MAAKDPDSIVQAANDYFDALIKSRFIEMFGDPRSDTKRWPVFHLIELSSEDKMPYGVAATAVDYDGEIRYIRITDICEDGKLGQDRVSPDSYEEKHILHDNDFLFARTGSVGRTFLYKEHYGKAVFAGYLIKFVPDTKKIDPVFLYYYTKTDFYNEFIESMSHGGVQANINAKQYGSLKICLPPISMQKEFVNFVDQVDKSKLVFQQMVSKLDQLVKSRFIEMFGSLEKISLTNVAKITMGQSPDSASYNESGIGMPFYQGKTEFGDVYVTTKSYCSEPKKIAKPMDILMSVRAPVGSVNITREECCIGRGLAAITPIQGIATTRYIFIALQMIEKQISDMGTGSTFKAINKNHMHKIMIPNAKMESQKEFISFVEQVDKSKLKYQAIGSRGVTA